MERELDDGDWADLAASLAKPLPPEPWRRPRGWRTSQRRKRRGRIVIAVAVLLWALVVASVSPPVGLGIPMFVGFFVALVALFVPGGIRDALRSRALARRAAEHPDEPWLADHPWDPRGTSVSVGQRLFAPRRRLRGVGSSLTLHFVGTYCAMAVLAYGSWTVRASAGGLALLFVSWRLWRAHGMGAGHVSYSRFPFHPGERVTLWFGMSAGGATFERAVFYLRAVVEGRGSGLGSPGSTFATFELREHRPPGLLPGPEADVELAFDLPEGVRGTELSVVEPHYWVLEVVANTSAGPYCESFLVPIYERVGA